MKRAAENGNITKEFHSNNQCSISYIRDIDELVYLATLYCSWLVVSRNGKNYVHNVILNVRQIVYQYHS